MSNDDNESFNNSGIEQCPQLGQSDCRIKETNECIDNASSSGLSYDEQPDEAVLNKIVDAESALQALGITSSWSGLLPPPDEFSKYPDYVQKRMLEWNDATILDESERQSKLVKAKIKDGYLSSTMSFIIQFAVVIGAFVTFIITGDPRVFWAYTIPGAAMIGNIILNISIDRKSNNKDIPE